MIEQGDEEVEPTPIHPLRRGDGAVQGEGLVAHPEDEIPLLPPCVPIFAQHSQAIEQVAGVDHEGHDEGIEGLESAHQQIHCDELHGAGKNEDTHGQDIEDGQPHAPHEQAVG